MERREFIKMVPLTLGMLFIPQAISAAIPEISSKQIVVEKTILKSFIMDNELISQCIERLPVFQHEPHRLIMNAIRRLHDRLEPVDLVTIFSELNNSDLSTVGGCEYLGSLVD